MFVSGGNQPNAWHDDVTASFGINFWREKDIVTCLFQVTYYVKRWFLLRQDNRIIDTLWTCGNEWKKSL